MSHFVTCHCGCGEFVRADAQHLLDGAEKEIARERKELAALREERAALLRDKERLGYLERRSCEVSRMRSTTPDGAQFWWSVEPWDTTLDTGKGDTLRDAIDAAMREETP